MAVCGSYRPGEIILKLRAPGPGQNVSRKATQDFFARTQKSHGLHVLTSWSSIDLHHVKIDPASTATVEQVIADLSKMPEVQYAEPNFLVQKSSTDVVTQSYTLAAVQSFLVSMSGGGVILGLSQANIQATNAWPVLTTGSSHAVVAVIDTGIDFNHPVFANAIWTNKGEIPNNGIDDDQNGYVDDVHGWNFAYNSNNPQDDEGHGTHVSGIVLGVGQYIFQTPAPPTNVDIMPLKFLDYQGTGTTSDAIKAIYYAANNGAKVMNNSWGGGDYSQALNEAIAYAYNRDSVFVAAAGNAGTNNDSTPTYPASYDVPNVIAVAASNDQDVKPSFSNYGTQSVPLSAPGVSILSTYPGGFFARMSGTSMASPFVAGLAALMRYQNPGMNSYQVKQLILNGVDQISTLSPFVKTSGRLDVLNSVNLATSTPVDPYKPVYTMTLSSQNRGLASSMGARGGGCGLISVVGSDFLNPKDPRNTSKQVVVIMALLLLPFMLWSVLRRPETSVSRRKHDRFAINTSVAFDVGGKHLVGAVKTISLGGSDLNTEALLEQGSIVTMSIQSPDGKSKIDVQGHIVWSEERKRYGVAFDGVADAVKAQIVQWQKSLVKV